MEVGRAGRKRWSFARLAERFACASRRQSCIWSLVRPSPRPLRVSVDGGGEHTIEVSMPTLYTLLDGDGYGEHLLELECATPGLSLFSATFG